MKIPANIQQKWAFYLDILRKCTFTRGDRRANYNVLRQFYLYGQGAEQMNRRVYNKIYPTIDQISSFLYSQETTRFTLEMGVSVSDLEIPKIKPMSKMLAQEWNTSNTDTLFGYCVRWAMCYSSMFVKTRWKKGVEAFAVDPHNFSVLREDVPQLSRQEAFAHTYLITASQLRNELEAGQNPHVVDILSKVSGSPRTSSPATVGPVDRIVVSTLSPNIQGSVLGGPWFGMQSGYLPRVSEPLIEMNELYVYDDEIADYRVVTIAAPDQICWDRPIDRIFLKNEAPFVQICPSPTYDYFYGISEVERLVALQEMLNERTDQIAHLLSLQARPPKDAAGYSTSVDELMATLNTPDGMVSSDMQGAKVTVHQPKVPEDIYKEVREIFSMFDEMSSLTNVNQGRGESGVRSTGQASLLSRLGSARPKQRALVIEDSLEKLATLYVMMMKRYSDKPLREDGENGVQFQAHHFPDDFIAKVDAHSSSPIFLEQLEQLAFELFKAKAIDREELLDLVQVPMRDLLQQKLRTKIMPAEAKAAEEEKKMKLVELKSHQKQGGA